MFMRVYERFRVVWTAVSAVQVMGRDWSLAGAGGLVTIVGADCARVVRTLTWWDELVGSCRVKSGYVG